MPEFTKTFQCEINGDIGLTIVIKKPNRHIDPVQISIGKIGDIASHRAVYLDRGMVANMIRFLTGPTE